MRSGVSRARVRSRFRWRMISWPAAKQIKCVKPSIATVSPSRTSSAIASCIVVTLDVLMGRRGSRPGGYLVDGLGEQPQRNIHFVRADGERRRHPDRRPAGLQDEQAALEG